MSSARCGSLAELTKIANVTSEPCVASRFVRPHRVLYKSGGRERSCLVGHAHSVSVVVFNATRKRLVFVRQFRPAVYLARVPEHDSRLGAEIDTTRYPPETGVTLEFCAGLVDKSDKSLREVAAEELLEECGYQIDPEKLELVTCYAAARTFGTRQTIFYAEVTDEMKVSAGGGLEAENELIVLEEKSVEEARQLLSHEYVPGPAGMLFGVLWFLQNKAAKFV